MSISEVVLLGCNLIPQIAVADLHLYPDKQSETHTLAYL